MGTKLYALKENLHLKKLYVTRVKGRQDVTTLAITLTSSRCVHTL